MATEFKCDYCPAILDKNVTLVHTERYHGLWNLDCSICPDCFKHVKVLLEKAKSQKSGVAALAQQTESLNSDLQFVRHEDPICDQLMTADPNNELVTVVTKGGETMKAHRSILISRSAIFKTVLTSDKFKTQSKRNESAMIKLDLPTHPASFRAFIQFLYTAELKPEILKKHAPELMATGNTYRIEMLTRKCEDYIVNNMTTESAIKYLKVANQCNSEAITAAAVKQIQGNSEGFFESDDYKALRKTDPEVGFGLFKYMVLEGKEKEKNPEGSDPGSDPLINSGLPRNHRYESSYGPLGNCTCSVHPFAHSTGHSAAPGFVFGGVHFQAATATPSTVHCVDPASGPNE